MKILKKLTAFTLAETLIVMGIIGVVAALTIPSLTNSTNNKDTVAKVKKAHSVMEDAFGRMVGQYGEIDEWDGTTNATAFTTTLGDRMASSMKLTKNCKMQNSGNCFGNATMFGSNGTTPVNNVGTSASVYKAVLADGTSVGFYVDNTTCSEKIGTDNSVSQDLKQICGTALIDVDGLKGKNKQGQDLFQFYITKTGIFPVGTEKDTKFNPTNNCLKSGQSSELTAAKACTAWVIYNGNMDYKKASNDGKCLSNGKELNWTTNTFCD